MCLQAFFRCYIFVSPVWPWLRSNDWPGQSQTFHFSPHDEILCSVGCVFWVVVWQHDEVPPNEIACISLELADWMLLFWWLLNLLSVKICGIVWEAAMQAHTMTPPHCVCTSDELIGFGSQADLILLHTSRLSLYFFMTSNLLFWFLLPVNCLHWSLYSCFLFLTMACVTFTPEVVGDGTDSSFSRCCFAHCFLSVSGQSSLLYWLITMPEQWLWFLFLLILWFALLCWSQTQSSSVCSRINHVYTVSSTHAGLGYGFLL